VYVADPTEVVLTSPEQVLSWITKGESKAALIESLTCSFCKHGEMMEITNLAHLLRIWFAS